MELNSLNLFASIFFKCIQLLFQSHLSILNETYVKLNCFKDDNVKIVFASTLNVFLLLLSFYVFCSLVHLTTTLSGIFNPRPNFLLTYENGFP